MKLGLKKKIILVIEIAIFSVALCGGAISLLLQKNYLEKTIQVQLESISVLKTNSIERYIGHTIEELESVSNSGVTRNVFIRFLDKKDEKIKKEVYDVFDHILEEKDVFSDVFILDKNGVITASSKKEEEGISRNQEYFFLDSKTQTKVHDFYFHELDQKSELIATVPIIDDNGVIVGILVSNINISYIDSIVGEKSGLGETGESFLLDKSNRVFSSLSRDSEALLKIVSNPDVKDCLQDSDKFSKSLDYSGVEVFEYLRWLPDIKLCLVTKIDKQEALSPMREITFYVILAIGIISIIIGIFGYILGQSIVRPLKKLEDFIYKIKKGDLEVRVDINSKDEIEDIASAFNDMTEHISKHTGELEAQVKSRTVELDQKVVDVEQAKRAVVNLLEDISEEKKRAEGMVVIRTKELNDEKSRLIASINSLDMGFAIVDDAGMILVNNPSLLSVLEFTDKIKDIDEISNKLEMKLSLKKRLDLCKEKKCVIEMKEVVFGSKFLRIFLTPVFSKGKAGLPLGGVLIVEDITEAKILERSKDEFFAVASHELRTPLTAIRGNTDMLLDMYGEKIKDKEIKDMILDINEASKRLIGIVNDFLDASRLEQGKITLENKTFNITEAIEKVVNSLKESADEKKLSLEFIKNDISKLEVFADMEKVEQVLFNLIGNSIKFTSVGKVEVSFSVSNGFVKISISDTGPGISAQNENLLFRKFQPAGEQILVRDVTKSTGLGLYISRLLISKMGGTIGLEKSVVGKGSTFFFTLPLSPM